jgi:formylglycine-generating enzyme required for sulfatase activity
VSVDGQTVSVPSFYILETEITNQEYRNFLNDLKQNGKTDEYKIAMVDTNAWTKTLEHPSPFINHYFQDVAYNDFPVVNISYEDAQLYCKWLTNIFQASGNNINVRLPNEAEWIYAAKGGSKNAVYSNRKNTLIEDGKNYCAFNGSIACDGSVGKTLVTSANVGFTNKYNLYNMCGNVAEMLSEKGEHKGGSYNSDAEHVKINAEDEYEGIIEPSPYIGFRPVVVIKM